MQLYYELVRLYVCCKLFIHWLFLSCRWNPKKRLTPDEALRHPWILSGLNLTKSGELRHSHSEINISHDSSSHSSSSTSGGSSGQSRRVHHKYSIIQKSDKVKAKIVETRLHDSVTKLDSNLNDSGTFLPPIL